MDLPADPGLLFITFTAPAGTPDDDALSLLGTWAASPPKETPARP